MVRVSILAAGFSSRMGSCKALLPINQIPLILDRVKMASALPQAKISVVVGAHEADVRRALENQEVEILWNPEHALGQGSSLRVAIEKASKEDTQGILILLMDQVLIRTQQLENFLVQPSSKIVASFYQGSLGVPVYFPRGFFSRLLELPLESGFKTFLQSNADQVMPISLPEASFDLDTPEDYQDFLCRN